MVSISFQLSDELVEQAETSGLLTNEGITELLRAELERKAVRAETEQMMQQLQAAAHAEFGDMTEAEFLAMVNEEVKSVRAEVYAEKQAQQKPKSNS